MALKYKGNQGDWLPAVTFPDGSVKKLPTALDHYRTGMHYSRTDATMSLQPAKLRSWVEAIRATGMVVLVKAPIAPGHEDKTSPRRTVGRPDYIGVYKIANLRLEGDGEIHSFDLVERIG